MPGSFGSRRNPCVIPAKDGESRAPLLWASAGDYRRIARVLLSKGASPNAKDLQGNTVSLQLLTWHFARFDLLNPRRRANFEDVALARLHNRVL